MQLSSDITAYDPAWPQRYADAARQLQAVWADTPHHLHHVGSTAVPGLAAKPEIDILLVVDDPWAAQAHTAGLQALGFRRGSDLSPGHSFFKRDVQGVRTHKLHVCMRGHAEIARMLAFCALLRSDEALRQGYQALKLHLAATNTHGLGEYLEKKAPFIQAALARCDLDAHAC